MATQFWFTDGHLLPYTGEHKVHYAYHRQGRSRCRVTGLAAKIPGGKWLRIEVGESPL